MKKDFFEIMKNYDPEIKSFSVSSENIKEKTMSKINKPKRKFQFTRKFSPVIAVTLACITAGVGVLAYELSTLDRAVQFYEEHPYASQTIDEKDKEVLTDLLKAETTIVESNGATMELTGSMYDENKMLLFFKFTAPENIVLDQEQYTFDDWMFHHNSDSTGGAGSGLYFNDTDMTDNITYFTYEIDCDGFKAQEFTDIHFEDLCLLASPDKKTFAGDTVFEGEWLMPLNLSTPSESVYLLDESIKIYNPERYYRVYDIKISSLTLWIDASYEITNVDISVIMKDGSIINEVMGEGGGSAGSENGFSNIYSFGKPINLSEVKSIKLNDTEISVEDKYAEKYGNVTEATEPDTTGMTEIFASSINISATDDPIILKSIKIDDKNIAISLNTNNLDYAMTIKTKDQSEIIPFGNGTDADGDGIYTEIHKLRNEYEPEDIVFIDIENSGVRLDVAQYLEHHN